MSDVSSDTWGLSPLIEVDWGDVVNQEWWLISSEEEALEMLESALDCLDIEKITQWFGDFPATLKGHPKLARRVLEVLASSSSRDDFRWESCSKAALSVLRPQSQCRSVEESICKRQKEKNAQSNYGYNDVFTNLNPLGMNYVEYFEQLAIWKRRGEAVLKNWHLALS